MEVKNVSAKPRLEVLDIMRGLAIIMVVVYHVMEVVFGPRFLMVPGSISENLARLNTFGGANWWNLLENVFGAIFAYGFAAVNVFVILSGLVLTWGMVRADEREKVAGVQISSWKRWSEFYVKKLKRILGPLYVAVVIGFGLLAIRNWLFPALNWWPGYSWFDWVKYILPPFFFFDIHWIQQLEGNYWYITLILQLYLIFPVLYWILKKAGIGKFMLSMLALTIGYRVLASFGFTWLQNWGSFTFLDSSPMGVIAPTQNGYVGFAFFLPRMFEFAFGMAIGYVQASGTKILEKMEGIGQTILFLIVALVGFWLDTFRLGWVFSDLVIGVGLFGLLLNIGKFFQRWKWTEKSLFFLGDYSFEIYLLHGFWLSFIFLSFLYIWNGKNEVGFWITIPALLIVVIITSILARKLEKQLANWYGIMLNFSQKQKTNDRKKSSTAIGVERP